MATEYLTVLEAQEQAREFERSGDPARALAVYEDLAQRFERDPKIAAGAPDLYIRIGDLHARLGQIAPACAAYHQAAEYFALRGSGEHVGTLCCRIARLSPADNQVYVLYVRRLNAYGHVSAALSVVKEYAVNAGLTDLRETVVAALAQARGGAVPHMEGLLERFEHELKRLASLPGEQNTYEEPELPATSSRESVTGILPGEGRTSALVGWAYTLGGVALVLAGLVAIVLST